MDSRLTRLFGLQTNPLTFFTSALLTVAFIAVAVAFTEPVAGFFEAASLTILETTGWFYILGVTTFVGFLLWVAMSRHGRIRLGADDERPKYSDPVWFAMLFAAGIGTILMFWGVAEPISHFRTPPIDGVEPGSPEAAEQAVSFALYHFGLHTWAIFGLPALGFAYFTYRRGLPMRVSSVLYPILGERIHGPIGNAVDIAAILGTIFGVATSLGLGTLQINSGLSYLAPIPDGSLVVQVALLAGITVIAVISVALGLDAGIRRLSTINIVMAVGLMVFVLIAGPTVMLLRGIVESTGHYLDRLPQLAFWNDTFRATGWQGSWTVFYWAWTITWAPFVGIFIARISRGRTIREFVLGLLLSPTLFTIIWFSTFGITAIDLDLATGGAISAAVAENVPQALFLLLENFPWSAFISALSVLIVVIFFTTSADSAALVIDMLASSDVTDDPPTRQRVFWAVSLGVVAATLLATGGLEALQQTITVIGMPFFLLGMVIVYSIARGLREDEANKAS
jgi:choline/glycine/proline betaine transport protein